MRIEYRIIGRYRKNEKRFVVDSNREWCLEDAEKRLKELEKQSQYEMENKKRKVQQSGMLTIGTPYYSDYDLLDLEIQSREVTPWKSLNTTEKIIEL